MLSLYRKIIIIYFLYTNTWVHMYTCVYLYVEMYKITYMEYSLYIHIHTKYLSIIANHLIPQRYPLNKYLFEEIYHCSWNMVDPQ